MSEGIEQIGKKSVAWSYLSTLFTIGAGVILLPFILHNMPADTVAIWNVFQAIYALTILMDFGFRPSFARNISYVFSGVRKFEVNGVNGTTNQGVDYSLLAGTINAMRRFYTWASLAVLTLLLTIGTVYFFSIMEKYHGDTNDAIAAWFMSCAIYCYNLYTYYYDALLTGKGYIKQIQQITVLGQSAYIIIAIALLYAGFGLTAIITAQIISTIIKRIFAYKTFYTNQMNLNLKNVEPQDSSMILRIISPNAIKVGLTQFGGYIINKASLFVGMIYLSMEIMAAYGICIQIINILARCGTMLYVVYTPRLAQCHANNDKTTMKHLYILCVAALFIIYILGGCGILFLGNDILRLIHSNTYLLPYGLLSIMLVFSLLEQNHIIAAGFIQAGNKIPFFIPSLLSCAGTIMILFLLLKITNSGVLALILAPGIVQLCYQNWKWPSIIIKYLK